MRALALRSINCDRTNAVAVALAGQAVRQYNNNNDALLSQTWVIAKATVLRVRTVPYVEPYTFG